MLQKHLKLVKQIFGQANKGCWWMPWHQQAMKDALTCEKLR
jgi:hypothetical protein